VADAETAEAEEKKECSEGTAHSHNKKPLSRGETIRGNYENKIRFFAAPEKVFEIFAHEKDENDRLVMSYADFLNAITPFNGIVFEQEAEEYLKGNH
jgi:hypothetical protein